MASTSITRKYDVFVSFRGEIRLSFMDHLFAAFQRKGIVAFRDDTMIKKGESLAPELVRAIEGSLVYVVVFSKDFASSTWCLRELEMIVKCVRGSGKHVFPVFYDVDPSEVRRQNVGNYAEAFANHEERFKQDLDMVQNWKDALTHAADLSGWDMRHKPQNAEIENLVKEILNVLGHNHKIFGLPKDVVGMHSPINELLNHLILNSVDDVRVIGISGLGGIGKSTLVSILYGTICHRFDACCLIDDVSQIYRHGGPLGALQLILRQILQEPLSINNIPDATRLIQHRLCRLRALIILDNVDHGGQLEKLVVDRECLAAGSRMIIVSRDEHILKEYGVDVLYNVPLLSYGDSRQLFCRKAFKHDYECILGDVMGDYKWLIDRILEYANGLPLAIKVLGSFLFGRDISEWKSTLARLKEVPNNDIMNVLRISFDGLEEMEKEIFLDIACFFVNHVEKITTHVLNSCGFYPDIGLRVLIDKSLITSEVKHEFATPCLKMHNLLQELGRQIVQGIFEKNPRKWSRLWTTKTWGNIVQENMERNIEAIVLNDRRYCNKEGEISIGETLSKMSHLRLLIVHEMDLIRNLNCHPNAYLKLRYLHLDEYPFEYLPSSFHPNQLVDLHLPSSRIKQLWKGKKYLPYLRNLNLRHSKNLIIMPDFSEIPNIEWLNLKGCTQLRRLGPSNDVPRKLAFLDVKDCKYLRSLPKDILGLNSLGYLNISGCSEACGNVDLFSVFKSIIRLPFHSLFELDVSFCNLGEIPDAIGCLYLLERLNLRGNNFVMLPSLEKLSKLEYLNLEHCYCLKSLTKLPSPATSREWDLPMFPKDKYWEGRGMYIFNCPVLVQRERCSNMVSSWMMQFIQGANQQSSAPFQYVDTIIPGSGIPSCFANTSGSSRIWMNPPSDSDVIGLVYCAVFPVTPRSSGRSLKLSIRFCKEDFGEYGFSIDSPVIFDNSLITVKSTHMWLIYFPLKSFLYSLKISQMSLRYSADVVIDTTMGETPSVKVMNHGYNWVSKEDLPLVMKFEEIGNGEKDQSHNFPSI